MADGGFENDQQEWPLRAGVYIFHHVYTTAKRHMVVRTKGTKTEDKGGIVGGLISLEIAISRKKTCRFMHLKHGDLYSVLQSMHSQNNVAMRINQTDLFNPAHVSTQPERAWLWHRCSQVQKSSDTTKKHPLMGAVWIKNPM